MLYYFAYGSNMSSDRLRERVGAIVDHGWATLKDFVHLFDKRGSDGTAKGNVVERPGSLVHGVLYQLDSAQFDELDRYENGYSRIEIEVTARRTGPLPALTYSARDEARAPNLAPAPDYVAHYLRGAQEHGLPEDYVRALCRLLPAS